jgi:transporter family-2 protein
MFWIAIALISGTALALQAGCNGTLARGLGGPIAAALTSFSSGALVLAAVTLTTTGGNPRISFPSGQLPWWAWCGGILGAAYVAGSAAAAQRLGAANLVALVITAQLAVALALDHFALIGFSSRPLTITRLLGLLLLLGGTVLVRRG